MPAGLPFGTTIVSTLVAKVSTSPVTPASSARPIDVSSAVASTSPGAPSATCSARSVLEPKEKVHVDVVLLLERRRPARSKTSVSEAAASTVSSPPPSASLPPSSPPPQAARGRTRARDRAGSGTLHFGDLHDDVGGLHAGDGAYARLEAELVRGVAAHQRHDAVGAADHLDLGHHVVALDPGDDPAHPVAGADRAGAGAVALGDLARLGQVLGELGEVRPRDGRRGPRCAVDGIRPGLHPAAYGVVADRQDLGRLRDSVGDHGGSMPHLRSFWRMCRTCGSAIPAVPL